MESVGFEPTASHKPSGCSAVESYNPGGLGGIPTHGLLLARELF